MKFSGVYCCTFAIRAEPGIYPLPFGLLLKSTDGTREEEALATTTARAMGLPVLRCLSYGYHGDEFPGSILMTRIPGVTLDTVMDTLSESELSNIAIELEKRVQNYAGKHGGEVLGGGWERDAAKQGLLVSPGQ